VGYDGMQIILVSTGKISLLLLEAKLEMSWNCRNTKCEASSRYIV
jgi:hypothetical protein